MVSRQHIIDLMQISRVCEAYEGQAEKNAREMTSLLLECQEHVAECEEELAALAADWEKNLDTIMADPVTSQYWVSEMGNAKARIAEAENSLDTARQNRESAMRDWTVAVARSGQALTLKHLMTRRWRRKVEEKSFHG